MTRTAILSYGLGNVRSVAKAIERVGGEPALVEQADDLASHDKAILPGVGNFADGMRMLGEQGWVEPIRAFADAGKPLLSVCMGMQFLLDGSEEEAPAGELVPGLGLVPGRVVRFDEATGDPQRGGRLKVPHMGWNALQFEPGCPLFAGLEPGCQVYFVHGYYCVPQHAADAAATTDYGQRFCSALHRDNLWATQFHPEKSQAVGLRILKNFVDL